MGQILGGCDGGPTVASMELGSPPSSRMDARFPATLGRWVVVGAICWTLGVFFFIDQGIAEAASKVPYSPITNYISDLGVTSCSPSICSPLHALIDWTFVAVGVLQALGAILLFPAWPRQSREWINGMIGLALVPLAGACLTIAGLAPENVSPEAHATAAKIGIYLLNAAVLQIGISLVRVSRVAGVLSLIAAVTGWVGIGLLFGAATAVPVGLSERLADYPGTAVLVALGVIVLVKAIRPWPN